MKRGAAVKKEELRENSLQRKLTEGWLVLPEKERAKYQNEEERKRRLEIKEAKENLWKWKKIREQTMKEVLTVEVRRKGIRWRENWRKIRK